MEERKEMLKKTMKLALVSALVFGLAMLTAGIATATDAGPADITLKTAAAKKPAPFPHKKHQDMLECAKCHHNAEGKYVEGAVGKCASCHNKDIANEKLNSFKKAAHKKCKGCHKAMKKEGKKAPTKCTGCHPKKKK